MVNNKDGNTVDRTFSGSLVRYGTGNGVPIQQKRVVTLLAAVDEACVW